MSETVDPRLYKLLKKHRRNPRQLHAHFMVAESAREWTLALYEEVMSNNDVRAEWKRTHPGATEQGLQAAFVKKYLYCGIAPARATLTAALRGPYDDAFKMKIHEALVLDNTLVRGRNGPITVAGAVNGGK